MDKQINASRVIEHLKQQLSEANYQIAVLSAIIGQNEEEDAKQVADVPDSAE